MDTVRNAMENIPDQLLEQFEREIRSAHGEGTVTKKNRASKGDHLTTLHVIDFGDFRACCS